MEQERLQRYQRILILGQGGREHALAWKLRQSPYVRQIFCAPGNGGTAAVAENVPLAETDTAGLVRFCQTEAVDLVIVGPEQPLSQGVIDALTQAGIPAYGPTAKAATIEASKSFAKDLMRRYGIPTAASQAFDSAEQALAHIQRIPVPFVVKADGLAAGKGVTVCQSRSEGAAAIRGAMEETRFGEAGRRVVVEDYLEGEEVSLMAFVSDTVVRPMEAARDHKPAYDGDQGPNTGGMGAYSPAEKLSPALYEQAVETILKPTAQALVDEGIPFCGVLYAGLMLTENGPQVVEFNARFGDPETQVVLPRLETDLIAIIDASLHGTLGELPIHWSKRCAVSVVLASAGYPGAYEKGLPITLPAANSANTLCFHAGTTWQDKALVTSGGRVLAITGLGVSLAEARVEAYRSADAVHFPGLYCRSDIGQGV